MSDWWNTNLPKRLPEFEGWLKGPMDETRVPVRKIVRERACKSFLDTGAGLCAEYEGFKRDGYNIDYCGLEPCAALRETALRRYVIQLVDDGLPDINTQGQQRWDCVHCRGVLEHLPRRYDVLLSLSNMIRVARKCVLVSFFIPPNDPEEVREAMEGGAKLWHNKWSRIAIADHLQSDGRIHTWQWQSLPRGFELLDITVR